MNIDVDLSPITALIIDDSRYARSFIKTALQSFGIKTILEAGDGPAGLEILGQQPVHLVIVDHDMAPMDGIDFTRFVRAGDMVACDDGRGSRDDPHPFRQSSPPPPKNEKASNRWISLI